MSTEPQTVVFSLRSKPHSLDVGSNMMNTRRLMAMVILAVAPIVGQRVFAAETNSVAYDKEQVLQLEGMRTHFRAAPVDASMREVQELTKHVRKGDSAEWVNYLLGPPHSRTIHVDHRTELTWSKGGEWRLYIYVKDGKVDEVHFFVI